MFTTEMSSLADGTMMSGNQVSRNIMLSNTPGVKYGDLRSVSPKWNTIDRNLVWNGGQRVTTGFVRLGPDLGPPLLAEAFDDALTGKLPMGWGLNAKANPEVKLIVADGCLQADCARGEDFHHSHTVLCGPEIPVKTRGTGCTFYRIRCRVKQLGFKPLPIDQMGLIDDEWRKN